MTKNQSKIENIFTYVLMKLIVCRRQDHNLEMEAAVAGPSLAVTQDGDGAPPGDLPSCNICDKTFKTLGDVILECCLQCTY